MEEKLDIKEILRIIKKRFLIIASITMIAAIASGILSFYIIKPVYESNTTLIVNKSEVNTDITISSDELSVNKNLAITYGKIIKSRSVLNKVIDNLNLGYKYDELYNKVVVEPIDDTQIIKVSVKDTDAKKACDIANSIPQVFIQEITRLGNTNKIEVIDEAVTNNNPIKPNKVINIAIATMAGFFIGMIIAFLLEYFDTKIKNQEEVEKYLGLYVIGIIPKDTTKK